MKIFKKIPVDVLRIKIMQAGFRTETLTVHEATQEECIEQLKEMVAPYAPVFPTGNRITIEVREAKKGKNGKSRSFHFYGLNPNQIKELIQYTIE